MKKTLIALMTLAGIACGATTIDAEFTTAPSTEGDKSGSGEGTPTPTPDATGTNAGGKKTRNLLLGGLGVGALVAGIFLILLGKKKDEEEAK